MSKKIVSYYSLGNRKYLAFRSEESLTCLSDESAYVCKLQMVDGTIDHLAKQYAAEKY